VRSKDDENVVERNLHPRNNNSNFFIMEIATKMPVFGHRSQFVFLLDILLQMRAGLSATTFS